MRPRRQTSRSASPGWLLVVLLLALAPLLAPAALAPAVAATSTTTATTTPTPAPSTSGDPSETDDAADDEATPLTLRITSMSPGVVRPRGALVLTGTVRNDSDETWTEVNVAPFVGDSPIVSREELGLAAESPEETEVGSRLDTPGTFVAVGDLEPGDRESFQVRVPRDELPPASSPGVYWIGVHALGTDADGRDSVADGRARTFVPVLAAATTRRDGQQQPGLPESDAGSASSQVPVSLVLPLRQSALRAADGSLADPETWTRLASGGRLDRLSRFAASAGDRPLTWLLDPAVLDALSDLGQGNPPLSLGPPERGDGDPSGDQGDDQEGDQGGDQGPDDAAPSGGRTSGSATPSDAQAPPPSGSDPDIGSDGVPDAVAAAGARSLLQRLLGQLGREPVLSVPYADVDSMALARNAPGLLQRAVGQARATLQARGLQGRTVLAPPSGRVDAGVLADVGRDVGLLVSDRGDLDDPVSGLLDGRQVLLADARTGLGGPGPTAALDPLAVRQRLLAETSLEASAAAAEDRSPRPVVLVLPADWDPTRTWQAADFFEGLDVPWLRWTTPPPAVSEADLELTYPPTVAARETGATQVAAARELVRAGGVLTDLLANDNDVRPRLTGAALESVSYAARARPRTAEESVAGLLRTVTADLSRVSILGTDFVTLSSGSGTLTITVVNGLAQPVTVGLTSRTDPDVRVEAVEPLALGPEERATIRVPVSSGEGVHDVTLVPTTTEGQPAGQPFDFVLRTSQVGRTVWFVMAAGGALFAFALSKRIRQRLRERRATTGRWRG